MTLRGQYPIYMEPIKAKTSMYATEQARELRAMRMAERKERNDKLKYPRVGYKIYSRDEILERVDRDREYKFNPSN